MAYRIGASGNRSTLHSKRFHNAIGCHIKCDQPQEDSDSYIDRKHFFQIQVALLKYYKFVLNILIFNRDKLHVTTEDQ